MKHDFETLVVGSGPAGVAAAVTAAEQGQRVGLIDDNPSAGGQIWRSAYDQVPPANTYGTGSTAWIDRLQTAGVTQLQGWSVFDHPSPGTLRAERGSETTHLHFESLILATGARERFLPFPGWTLPNIMGAGALQAMVKSGLPIRDKRIVIAGSGPLLLAVAAFLQTKGANVLCICEQASARQLVPFAVALAARPTKIAQALRYKAQTWKTHFHTSAWPVEARGDTRLRSIKLSINGKDRQIDCDYLACGFHLVPNTELAALVGCNLKNGAVTVDRFQQSSIHNVYCAGETTGIGGLDLSLIEGQIAGLAAAHQYEKAQALFQQKDRQLKFAQAMARAFTLRSELKSLPTESTLLCRCEDVRYGLVREHTSWRAAKLQTRCGMGPCQGRICGAATEFLLGWNADSVRPPVFPSLISSLKSSSAEMHPQPHNQEGVSR